jgi:hypothetical protein
VNLFYEEQGAWIFGIKYKYEDFEPGFDSDYYPDRFSTSYFLVEILINAGNSDIDFDPRSVRIALGQGSLQPMGLSQEKRPTNLSRELSRAMI